MDARTYACPVLLKKETCTFTPAAPVSAHPPRAAQLGLLAGFASLQGAIQLHQPPLLQEDDIWQDLMVEHNSR